MNRGIRCLQRGLKCLHFVGKRTKANGLMPLSTAGAFTLNNMNFSLSGAMVSKASITTVAANGTNTHLFNSYKVNHFDSLNQNLKELKSHRNWKSFWICLGLGIFVSQLFNNYKSNVAASGPSETGGAPRVASVVKPDSFAAEDHFYPRVLNAQLHPMVRSFLEIGQKRLVERYCHLHPTVDPVALTKLLNYKPKYLLWSGADLFVVTNNRGERQLCVIETNTCPSGQKSMPMRSEVDDQNGYKLLLQRTFRQLLEQCDPSLFQANLAVFYDKNDTETTGYAATLADVAGEDVYLVEYYDNDEDPPVKFKNGVMYVRSIQADPKIYVEPSAVTEQDEQRNQNILKKQKAGEVRYEWVPIRAAFRYVTQKPWSRIPIQTKTRILNPVIVCLAGGRNKNIAAKAYEIMNSSLMVTPGLTDVQIRTPQTERDVDRASIPIALKRFGDIAVIKVPYGNAGQGVYTITCDADYKEFEADPTTQYYDKFIVQSLIGNSTWSSLTPKGRLYHVGTVPSKRGSTFAADIRMMIQFTEADGWVPLSVYSRRARCPLAKDLKKTKDTSWDMLGTNLSVKLGPNKWRTDVHRLMIMDMRDFNKLGIGIDDLISAYVQTVLASIAIDKMAQYLINEDGSFNFELFEALNPDQVLIDEFAWNKDEKFVPTKVV